MFRKLDPETGVDAIANVTGGRALVPAGDHVARAMRFVGDLDPKISWVVDRVVRPGDVALDLGANLGLVSLRLSARVGSAGHVHAFEPQPRMIRYLNKTLEMNPGLPITLHPVALGCDKTTLVLAVPEHNAGAATLYNTAGLENRAGMTMVQVPVVRLSDYAEAHGLTRVDFIKIDVEGFEDHVLQGGAELLARTRPKVIVLEENAVDPTTGRSAALDRLESMGYDIFALPKRIISVKLYPVTARQIAHDYVAVSQQAPSDIRQSLDI